jgi:hypothetical protein
MAHSITKTAANSLRSINSNGAHNFLLNSRQTTQRPDLCLWKKRSQTHFLELQWICAGKTENGLELNRDSDLRQKFSQSPDRNLRVSMRFGGLR